MADDFKRYLDEREAEFKRYLDERDADFKRYLHALTERHVGITQQLIETINSGFSQLQAEIADQRRQIQANTEALLRVLRELDRLEPRHG